MASPSTPARTSSLRRSVAIAWRTLRSMRTALVLLLLMAAASVAGSLLPQTPNSPERVRRYLADHEIVGDLFARAGLFDVFGSWWFALITALLFTSLVACLIPRTRAQWRAMRTPPVHARELDAFPLYEEVRVIAGPAEAGPAIGRVLRRRRYRVSAAPDATSFAAEKGALREGGSLVFHWAFVLLLVAVVVGKGTGYSGRAVVVEGASWTDAAANYDPVNLRLGRFFGGDFSGLGIRLVRYEDAYDPENGMPEDFASTIELLDREGGVVGTEVVRVNHPVRHEDLRIYQYGFGWAPTLRVRDEGELVWAAPVVMGQRSAPEDRSQLSQPWIGFLKVPGQGEDPDIAVELELWPDGRGFLNPGTPMFRENRPLIRYRVWEGTLLDPSLARLDTRLMRRIAEGLLFLDSTADIERGCIVTGPGSDGPGACPAGGEAAFTLSFPELDRYSVLQVGKDTTVPLVLAAAILVFAGLLASLYVYRRKVWVHVEPVEAGSVLKIGGFALQRRSSFDEEFRSLVDELVRAAAGAAADDRQAVGSR